MTRKWDKLGKVILRFRFRACICISTHQDVDLLSPLYLLPCILKVSLPSLDVHVDWIDVYHVVAARSMGFAAIHPNVLASLEPLTCVEPGRGFIFSDDGTEERVARNVSIHGVLIPVNMDLCKPRVNRRRVCKP